MKKILGIILGLGMILTLAPQMYAAESGYIPGLTSTVEEPDGSGIPKDEPARVSENEFGYTGRFDIDSASSQPVIVSEGARDLEKAQILYWGGGVIRNEGTASLVVKDSYIRGETAVDTQPLQGEHADLLAAGNIRTVLAMGSSQTYFINSTVASRNLGAVTMARADQILESGQKELGVYTYGSEFITMDGGCGVYAGPFSNLYLYGSAVRAAETGIISDTYGNITLGTIAEGEKDANVAVSLNSGDKAKRSDKELGVSIYGGRNALVITSENNPSLWEYEGYTQDLIPWRHAVVRGHLSTLGTDMSLDKGVKYDPQPQAYIDHTAGSVILVKSTNAEIYLDECSIIPDKAGTGCLIQSVPGNDTEYMNSAPDGETYPGILLDLRNTHASGDIVHEDYQRDFIILMDNTTLDSTMNEYDCVHWNAAAWEEGFSDYIHDAGYSTHHGLQVSLSQGSVWNVTGESHISRLYTEPDCQVNGVIFIDGKVQENIPGNIYEGNIIVMPAGSGAPAGHQVESVPPQPDTSPKDVSMNETEPETTTAAEHDHFWTIKSDYPADCTHEGLRVWVCSICGLESEESIPVREHTWYVESELPATCTTDGIRNYRCAVCGAYDSVPNGENAFGHTWETTSSVPATCTTFGQTIYTCKNCGEKYAEDSPPLEHAWQFEYNVPVGCEYEGFDVYRCTMCGTTEKRNIVPATGHDFQEIAHKYPDCEYDEVYEYQCKNCGYVYFDTIIGTATGHDYQVSYSVPPACDSQGYDIYTCANC